jgi:hypothetical protein
MAATMSPDIYYCFVLPYAIFMGVYWGLGGAMLALDFLPALVRDTSYEIINPASTQPIPPST